MKTTIINNINVFFGDISVKYEQFVTKPGHSDPVIHHQNAHIRLYWTQ